MVSVPQLQPTGRHALRWQKVPMPTLSRSTLRLPTTGGRASSHFANTKSPQEIGWHWKPCGAAPYPTQIYARTHLSSPRPGRGRCLAGLRSHKREIRADICQTVRFWLIRLEPNCAVEVTRPEALAQPRGKLSPTFRVACGQHFS